MTLAADGFLVPARDLNTMVATLEEELLQMPQVALDTKMIAHGRMAARTIFIPAGTVLTGVLVNHDNICIVSGDITVTTTDGSKRLTGYHVLPSASGYKRAGVAHADTWWTCLWHTDLTNPIEIENDMTDEAEKLQTRLALEN
jgi:hypothetical protein